MNEYDLTVAKDLIPAQARRWAYAVLSLVALAFTAILAGYGTLGEPVPSWVSVGLAVLGVLAGPFGFLAANNVSVASATVVVGEVEGPAGDDAA